MEGVVVRQFTTICVFCGSSLGNDRAFLQAAITLGKVLAERKISLVFGGGNIGLMGGVSIPAHVGGSQVLGIIPKAFSDKNIAGKTVGKELIVLIM